MAGERFEYELLVWGTDRSGEHVRDTLNRLGADGWEVVSMAPRASEVPMPGMGATAISELVIVLKRRLA